MQHTEGNTTSFDRNALLLAFAWLVAVVATLGSLYYSQIRHFIPCEMCWYQRICMYPNAIILGIALWRNDYAARWYALPLSIIGAGYSIKHLLEQAEVISSACSGPISCSSEYIPQFPIPLQALIAFVLITVSLLLVRPAKAH
jgi:disulfide bond formation protein DsbB